MTTLSFDEASSRFSHIDGFITDIRLRYAGRVEVDLRFYPWWEHPLYQSAVRRGARWGFHDYNHLARDVTLTANGLEVIHISGTSATDMLFAVDHPVLWCQDTDRRSIIVNSDVDRGALARAVEARMRRQRIQGSAPDVLGFLSTPAEVLRAPCSIGHFPRQVLDLVRGALSDLGTHVFLEEPRWSERDPRRLVQIDDTYLIASEIYLDVPEFAHPPDVYAGE